MTSFSTLDPLLHSQLRLAVMSLLVSVEEGDFKFLKDQTGATPGNLSIQLKKLEKAGYITIKKQFKKNYPQTTCSITNEGLKAFERYVNAIKEYIDPDRS